MDWRSSFAAVLVIPCIAHIDQVARADAAQNVTGGKPIAQLQFSTLKPDAILPLELERGALVVSDELWVPQRSSSTIVRVHAGNGTPEKPIALAKPSCASLAVIGEAVWVPLCDAGTLVHVHLKGGNVSAPAPLPVAEPAGSMAVAAKSLWVITDARGVVSRVDPETNAPVAEVYVPAKPFALAAEDDVVWVSSEEGNALTRIDAHTNLIVETIKAGPRPGPMAIGEGAVWILNRGDGSVSRVDPKSNKIIATIAVDELLADAALAVGEGGVWLSAPGVPIVRIDPRTNRVTHRFTGPAGGAIVVGHGSVWVNAGPKTTWRIDPKLIAAMRP